MFLSSNSDKKLKNKFLLTGVRLSLGFDVFRNQPKKKKKISNSWLTKLGVEGGDVSNKSKVKIEGVGPTLLIAIFIQ